MATTTPDNIYYPLGTDGVAPLHTVFANLASSVQTALTASRVITDGAISPAANVTIEARSYLKKEGSRVTLLLSVQRTGGIQAGVALATLPVGFRPTSGTVGVMGVLTAGGAPGAAGVYINTDGTINVNNYVTDTRSLYMVFSVTYYI